jgi:hypothetical protein
MHTFDPHEPRDERNMLGPRSLRALATNEQPKQTALRRTSIKLTGREAAQVGDEPRRRWAGTLRSLAGLAATAGGEIGCRRSKLVGA